MPKPTLEIRGTELALVSRTGGETRIPLKGSDPWKVKEQALYHLKALWGLPEAEAAKLAEEAQDLAAYTMIEWSELAACGIAA